MSQCTVFDGVGLAALKSRDNAFSLAKAACSLLYSTVFSLFSFFLWADFVGLES